MLLCYPRLLCQWWYLQQFLTGQTTGSYHRQTDGHQATEIKHAMHMCCMVKTVCIQLLICCDWWCLGILVFCFNTHVKFVNMQDTTTVVWCTGSGVWLEICADELGFQCQFGMKHHLLISCVTQLGEFEDSWNFMLCKMNFRWMIIFLRVVMQLWYITDDVINDAFRWILHICTVAVCIFSCITSQRRHLFGCIVAQISTKCFFRWLLLCLHSAVIVHL